MTFHLCYKGNKVLYLTMTIKISLRPQSNYRESKVGRKVEKMQKVINLVN